MTSPIPASERMRQLRERKKAANLAEVRGIWLPVKKHAAAKKLVNDKYPAKSLAK